MNIGAMIDQLQNNKTPVITVFGDFCLDKYLYVDIKRDEPSIETGLTAYQVTHTKCYAGAGGTITNNLRALGAAVYCVGIIGDDGEGYELVKCLKNVGADTSLLVHTNERCTCAYIKPMRYGDGTATEMNRQDFKNFTPTPLSLQERLLKNLKTAVQKSDAVIICDQYEEKDCAAVTEHIQDCISDLAIQYPHVVFYADSRCKINRFKNCFVKCNHIELARLFRADGTHMDKDTAMPLAAKLYETSGKPVFITFGEHGSALFDGTGHKIPAFRVEGPVDVAGAGDACNAGIVFALTKGLDTQQAALVGNAAASLVVQQIGVTGTARLDDVIHMLQTIAGV